MMCEKPDKTEVIVMNVKRRMFGVSVLSGMLLLVGCYGGGGSAVLSCARYRIACCGLSKRRYLFRPSVFYGTPVAVGRRDTTSDPCRSV